MRNRPIGCRGVVLLVLVTLVMSTGATPARGEEIVDTGTLFIGFPRHCDSPIGECTKSKLTGQVRGYKFTAQVGGPAADDPNTVVVTGNSVIKLRGGGRLFSDDIVRVNNVTGDVLHMWTITGGTGRHKGATGSMAAGGNLANAAVGVPYTARISIPDK